ncbi:MAG TPA: hypothetical protein VF119_00395, partial [Candidatus Limnocylindrales bacterium]
VIARSSAFIAVATLLVACAGPASPSTATDAPVASGAPVATGAPTAPAPAPIGQEEAREIEAAIAFRQAFGLRFDEGWVRAVAADPSAVLDWGVPLLPWEAAEIEDRPTGEDAITTEVRAYLDAHRDVSGGLYIDQAHGGIVTMLVTDDPESHRAPLRTEIGTDAPVVIRQVRWTEAELDALQARLSEDMRFYDTIPARFISSATDIIGNIVVLDVSSAAPDVGQRIADRVGAEPGQLRVVSDGTGILLVPTGTILGRIIAPPGTDLLTLSPQYEPDVPIGARDAVGIEIMPDGTFRIDDLPPTGYRVVILELLENGNREVGATHVVVPPGGVVSAEIPIDLS